MLRGSNAKRRLSQKMVQSNSTKNATLPDWGSRDLKIGTLRSAIRQLGIDWTEFQNT
jgi:predicted RNA binding protein YcfA (HicA-like mRNA interferase family)